MNLKTPSVSLGLFCSLSASGLAAPPEAHPSKAEVDLALRFLAGLQKEDGRFESLPEEPKSLVAMHGRMTMVLTAVTGLAMLAEGSTLDKGVYRDEIRKAKDYLVELVGHGESFRLAAYGKKTRALPKTHIANETPFMLLFLNEVHRTHPDDTLRNVIQSTINYIGRAQHASGGWDYTYRNERHHHTVTTIQNLAVLGVLKRSGFEIKQTVIDKALQNIRRAHTRQATPGYVRYSDQHRVDPGGTNRASGLLMALHYLDQKDHPLWADALTFYKTNLDRDNIYGGHSPAFQYFVTGVAASLLGDRATATYQKIFWKTLSDTQTEKGYWECNNGKSDSVHPHGGIVFETAITALVLQAPEKRLSFFK